MFPRKFGLTVPNHLLLRSLIVRITEYSLALTRFLFRHYCPGILPALLRSVLHSYD